MSTRRAIVDDSLVQAAGLRAIVAAMVVSARAAAPGAVEPADLARRIARTSPYAPSVLVDLLIEAAPSDLPLLYDVMAATPGPRLRDRIERLLERADLDPLVRDRLERAHASLEGGARGGDGAPGPGSEESDEEDELLAPTGLGLLRQVFGPRWAAWSPQRVAHLWLEYLHPVRQAERQAALAALLEEWKPGAPDAQGDVLIPVLEIEANWGGARIARWIVRQIARRPHAQGWALLHRLAHHRDEQVRTLAARTLAASPAREGRGALAPREDEMHLCYLAGFGAMSPYAALPANTAPEEGGPEEPEEKERAGGRAGEARRDGGQKRKKAPRHPPLHGPGTLLLARRSPDGTVRYVLLLVDLDERGVVECWGDDGLGARDFDRLLRGFERVGIGDPLDRVPAPLALMLANGAAALSLANDFVPPMEYYLWRELFVRDAYDARHFHVRFGGDGKALDQWRDAILSSPADLPSKPW